MFIAYVTESGKVLEFYQKAFNAGLKRETQWQFTEKEGIVVHHCIDYTNKHSALMRVCCSGD